MKIRRLGVATVGFGSAGALLAGVVQCGPGRFDGITGGRRDAAPDVTSPVDSGNSAREACVNECIKRYPTGRDLDDQVGDCFDDHCPATCESAGDLDAARQEIEASAGKTCAVPIDTEDPRCDQCIAANCCTIWTVCYGDGSAANVPTECELIDECYERCGVVD